MKISIEKRWMLPLIGALFIISGELNAQIYVKADATGQNDGSSWQDALTDLQDGINSAGTSGTQLWVAAGTYKPTVGTGRGVTFTVNNAIEIYGGFSGTETSLEQRDWRSNLTILSGDIGTIGLESDNAYTLLTSSGKAVLVDGVNFQHANNDNGQGFGGAIRIEFAQATVVNCTFRDNKAVLGGAMYLFQGVGQKIINSAFYNNTASNRGGAVHIGGSDTFRAQVLNCVFDGNVSENGGGGLLANGRPADIINCTFYDNHVNQGGIGGGGFVFAGSNMNNSTIHNSIFWANSAATGTDFTAFGPSTLSGDFNISTSPLGANGVNADPLLHNPANEGLQVYNNCSPAINGGDSTKLTADMMFDISGNERNQYGQVDIGAYELGGFEISSTDVACNGDSNGSFHFTSNLPVQVSFHTGPTFLGSVTDGTTSANNISVGTFPIFISVGCSPSINTNLRIGDLTVGEPDLLVLDEVGKLDATCNGEDDGEITIIAVNGGVAPYSYSLDGTNYLTNTSFAGLAPGNYTVYVQDVNGCVDSTPMTLTEPVALTVTATESQAIQCNGGSDGQITAAASGGAGGFMYRIDEGSFQSSSIFDNLSAGDHAIDVMDTNGCISRDSLTLGEPAQWVMTSASSDVLCSGGSDGSLSVSVTGGATPYSYSIDGSNFQTGNEFENLTAGNYTITIQDNQGCEDQITATIAEPSALSLVVSSVTEVTCNGEADGSINVSGSGGTSPYEYSLDGTTFQSGTLFDQLNAGAYTFTVRDANSCTATLAANIAQPSALNITVSSVTDVTCNGESDGSINVSGSGGTAPYEYSLDGTTFQSGTLFGQLGAGVYTVTMRDANGCASADQATVQEPAALDISVGNVSDVTCNGEANGSITVSGSGGTSPYEYSLDGTTFQSGTLFDQLDVGVYTVTVRDVNGCTSTDQATIVEPSALAVSVDNISDVTCNGQSDGSISMESTGGTAPFEYSINGVDFQTETMFEDLAAGTYDLTVRDANGCTASIEATIAEPVILQLSVTNISGVNCNGDSDGSISLEGAGGTLPFEFSLDGVTFQSNSTFDGLTAGTYNVTMRDASGCTIALDTLISQPDALSLQVSQNSNNDFEVSASGGVEPYEFSVDGGAFQSSTSFQDLAIGNHSFTVRDANGCERSSEDLIVLSAIDAVEVTMYPNPVTSTLRINGATGGTVRVIQLDGRTVLNAELNGGETEIRLESIESGVYLVQVRDSKNQLLCQQQIVKK